jgi:hypothetical protein
MGKDRDLAASVPWASIAAAIQANPKRDISLGIGGAAGAVTALPTETPALGWLGGGWTEDLTLTVSDAVALSLWIHDPLYRTASAGVRRAMEAEEATALLNASEEAWRSHNGRVCGWVRKHLEEDLRARSGSADPAPDFWESVRSQRRAALLLDYVCVMRSIRVALWWPEHKTVTVIPAASVPVTMPTIVQFNATSGRMLLGPTGAISVPANTWATDVFVHGHEMSWTPAASISAASAMTVAQIQEAIALIDPSAEKTGGRQVLWNRLQWLQLIAAVKPKPSD